MFHTGPTDGRGQFVAIDVPDVDAEPARLSTTGLPIALSLRDDPRGNAISG